MKFTYLKCIITALAASACFLLALAIAIHLFWFDSELSEHSTHFHSGAKRLEFARAYRQETYSDIPVILFLGIAALFLSILAIRFYNHAKSEFPGLKNFNHE